MDISSLGNFSVAFKPSAHDLERSDGLSAETSPKEVSQESQASLLPPPQAAGQAQSDKTEVPNPEQDTGNHLNVTV